MTRKQLISRLFILHASDDPIITAQKALDELYEMQQMLGSSRVVKRSITTLERYVHKKIQEKENINC
jgi:hypothetical protein